MIIYFGRDYKILQLLHYSCCQTCWCSAFYGCSGRIITNKMGASTTRLRKMSSLDAFPCPTQATSTKKHLLKKMSSNSLKLDLLHSHSFDDCGGFWFTQSNGTFAVVDLRLGCCQLLLLFSLCPSVICVTLYCCIFYVTPTIYVVPYVPLCLFITSHLSS